MPYLLAGWPPVAVPMKASQQHTFPSWFVRYIQGVALLLVYACGWKGIGISRPGYQETPMSC